MKNKISLFVATCLLSGVVASTVLTPNTNKNSGLIPSGHSDLQFNLSNGNWVQNLNLPASANDQDVITINSQAGYVSYLDTSNTDLPLESLTIRQGQSYSFVFDKTSTQWRVKPTVSYPSNGANEFAVINHDQMIQKVHVRNGQWARQITLPSNVAEGTLINVISDAGYDSSINTSNLLFASSYILKNGDSFWFKYSKELAKWVPESISPYQLKAQNVGSKITSIKAPLTEVIFADANWIPTLELPQTAKDRDRVVVKSSATWEATILNTNINTQATLKLNRGDRYEFMYVADIAKWVLMSSPQLALEAKSLNTQKLPDMKQPMIRVKIGNANWQANLALPSKANIGDKVIFSSLADWSTTITASNGLKQTISKGENQRYIFSATGWVKDSYTIDMLLVNSPEVSKSLGANAAKIRMLEAQDLTNVAAENSNAQFYIRDVGYLEYRIPGSTKLGDITGAGRDDKTIQNERNRVKADAVYYQGNEEGCGLAWVNKSPLAYNMLGTSSTNCGLSVMRHEFGHNMGVDHNDSHDSARGFAHPLGSTIMGGNSLPFFSSPTLYHPKYGYRLGLANKTDALSMINKNAPVVAQFR